MTYPTVEKKEQEKIERRKREIKEAELYIDSGSIEEFELKRSIEGINYKHTLDDMFKLYYFYKNTKLHYLNEEGVVVMTIMFVFLTTMFALLGKLFILLLIPALVACGLFIYETVMTKCKKACKLIKTVEENREEEAFKKSCSTGSISSSYSNNASYSYNNIPMSSYIINTTPLKPIKLKKSKPKNTVAISFQGSSVSLSC